MVFSLSELNRILPFQCFSYISSPLSWCGSYRVSSSPLSPSLCSVSGIWVLLSWCTHCAMRLHFLQHLLICSVALSSMDKICCCECACNCLLCLVWAVPCRYNKHVGLSEHYLARLKRDWETLMLRKLISRKNLRI